MKSETLVRTLTRLTTTMAIAAPFVVFGFLYVMRVQPERAAADRLRAELTIVRDEASRRRSDVTPSVDAPKPRALDEFDSRTPDRSSALTTALTAILNGAEVGGVSHLSVATRPPTDVPLSRLAKPFPIPIVQIPVMVTFDARYEQIGRFFSNLRAIPATFDLQSVEVEALTPSSSPLVRAKVTLLAFERTTPNR